MEQVKGAIKEFGIIHKKGIDKGLTFKENARLKVLESFICKEIFKLNGGQFNLLSSLFSKTVREA